METPRLLGVLRDERAQQLDRDVAFQFAVTRVPDDAHPAFPDLLEQLVAARQDRHQRSTSPPQLSESSDTTTSGSWSQPLYRA
jgi:hypothetical protein